MACTHERAQRIADLAGGRLDGDALEQLLEHIEGCAACSAELDLAADLVAQPPVVSTPGFLAASSSAWPLAAAALFLAVLGSWWWSGASANSTRELAQLAPLPAPSSVLRAAGQEQDDWDEAMALYAAGEYQLAIGKLVALRSAGDERPLLRLYVGVAAAQTGDFLRAASYLDSAAEESEGMVRARARWFRAQVHLASDQASAARVLLEAIAQEGGDYAPNAAALLEQLGGRE